MTDALNALSRKLTGQRQILRQKLQSIEQLIANYDQKIQDNQQKILNPCTMSASIQPEQEMARLRFMLNQQTKQESLTSEKKALEQERVLFNARDLRLNRELKMIEKVQQSHLLARQQTAQRTAQHRVDEWALQQGDWHEN